MRTSKIWVFDLDNTLHDASAHIFPRINSSMTGYLQKHLHLDEEEADRLRRKYWLRYGATLSGLICHHDINPRHFLTETHHFEKNMVIREPFLRHCLKRLKGKKIIFSNAPLHYALAVLKILRIENLFDAVFAIEHSKFQPKPNPGGFFRLFRKAGLLPGECIMVEDTLENLKTAKKMGMKTVWMTKSTHIPAYVDVSISSLAALPARQWRINHISKEKNGSQTR